MGIEWGTSNVGRQIPSSRPASPRVVPGAHFADHPAPRDGWPADDARTRLRRRRWPAALTLPTWGQGRPHLQHRAFIDALQRINHRAL